jgi:hypothetical protein
VRRAGRPQWGADVGASGLRAAPGWCNRLAGRPRGVAVSGGGHHVTPDARSSQELPNHAMTVFMSRRHESLARPPTSDMQYDEATCELTHAATGPGEHSPAACCPSGCPSQSGAVAARPATGQLSNANSLTATEQTDGRVRRPAADYPRDTRHGRRTKQPVRAAAITLRG